MEKRKDSKKSILILMLIFLFAGLAGGSYYLLKGKGTQPEDTTANEESFPDVVQGEYVNWESERISFFLPEGWSYEISTDENYNSEIIINTDALELQIKYLPVEKDSSNNWAKRDEKLYSNSVSVVFKEESQTKVAFNSSITQTNQDLINNTTEKQEYALFMIISKSGSPVEDLTGLELHYIKYLLGSYEESSQQ